MKGDQYIAKGWVCDATAEQAGQRWSSVSGFDALAVAVGSTEPACK